jgi:hypothetical protein
MIDIIGWAFGIGGDAALIWFSIWFMRRRARMAEDRRLHLDRRLGWRG